MNAPILAGMDDDDAILALQLLQEDAREAMSNTIGKGKRPAGVETDQEVVLRLMLDELQNAETFAADRKMCRSIQRAIQADADILVRSREEERMAQEDRNLSLALGEGAAIALPTSRATTVVDGGEAEDDEFLERLSCIYVTGVGDTGDDDVFHNDDETIAGALPESSAWALSRPSRVRREGRECDACGDEKRVAELAGTPCGRGYCRQCLTHLFRAAMVDESLFPPRCCRQPIPFDASRFFLDADVVRQFPGKALEFCTQKRTYCHNQRCGVFVPPSQYVDSVAVCQGCGMRTCITCKAASHGRGDCPDDSELQQVIQLAKDQGWQRCQTCLSMVELNVGCNHMT